MNLSSLNENEMNEATTILNDLFSMHGVKSAAKLKNSIYHIFFRSTTHQDGVGKEDLKAHEDLASIFKAIDALECLNSEFNKQKTLKKKEANAI